MPVAKIKKDPRKKVKSPLQMQHGQSASAGPPSHPSDFSSHIEQLRQSELPSLFPSGTQSQPALYLDSAGSPPVPKSLLQAHLLDLESNLFGNPHSQNPSSRLAAGRIEEVRNRVCKEIFGVERYPFSSSGTCSSKGKERELQDQHELFGWEIIFTASATASLKLAAECFTFNSGSFIHTFEAHTSLVGLREVATSSTPKNRGMEARECLALSEDQILEYVQTHSCNSTQCNASHLVALPLQCNATGARSFSLLSQLMSNRKKPSSPFSFLIDASSYLTSASRLDLSSLDYEAAPDLIAFSFAKIFGLTGLGGLLVKRSIYHRGLLDRKSYFGGGTLSAQAFQVLEQTQKVEVWRQLSEDVAKRLEDGSPNTHSIISIASALDVFQKLFGDWNVRRICVERLSRRMFQKMGNLKHGNGEPVVRIYTGSNNGTDWQHSKDSETSTIDQGPILLFNLLSTSTSSPSSSQSIIPPSSISRLATLSNIHLRTGRHCNPGVIQNQLGTTYDRIKSLWENGIGCGSEEGEPDEMEDGPSSATRVSLSIWNTESDVDRFVEFVERFFVIPDIEQVDNPQEIREFTLESLTIYPIKSAAGQRIPVEWEMCSTGLRFDREFCLVDLESVSRGEMKILSQKKFSSMARIRPFLDLKSNKMSIDLVLGRTKEASAQREELWRKNGWSWKLEIGLDEGQQQDDSFKVQVCADKVFPTLIQRPDVVDFFSRFLGIKCTLARMSVDSSRHSKFESGSEVPILFSNESPFLLLNSSSIEAVKGWIDEDREALDQAARSYRDKTEELENISSRFRGNLIIGSSSHGSASLSKYPGSHQTLVEDSFTKLCIGPHLFGVLGPCRRCQMIALDPRNGEARPETLLSLARRRRGRNGSGRVEFGLHLFWIGSLDAEGKEEGKGKVNPMIREGMKVRVF